MLRNLDKRDFAVPMTDDPVLNIIRVLKKEMMEYEGPSCSVEPDWSPQRGCWWSCNSP